MVNPAVKNSHDKGWPKNGMYIAFPESLRNNVTDVSPDYWRLQAAIIKFVNSSTLLVNSYFPTDPRRPNADQSELLETLIYIREVIRKMNLIPYSGLGISMLTLLEIQTIPTQ
jgi:hypothetical protein